MIRGFEFARKVGTEDKAFSLAQLPEYQTKYSAGADFFCAEEVIIPSVWEKFRQSCLKAKEEYLTLEELEKLEGLGIKPTLVHTGIKAFMAEDEYLKLCNRSSNPMKLGLVLANGIGVVDGDYYNNPSNDGEIMFAFYNFSPTSIKIEVGQRIGQGIFEKFLRAEEGLRVKENERQGGFGSTK